MRLEICRLNPMSNIYYRRSDSFIIRRKSAHCYGILRLSMKHVNVSPYSVSPPLGRRKLLLQSVTAVDGINFAYIEMLDERSPRIILCSMRYCAEHESLSNYEPFSASFKLHHPPRSYIFSTSPKPHICVHSASWPSGGCPLLVLTMI